MEATQDLIETILAASVAVDIDAVLVQKAEAAKWELIEKGWWMTPLEKEGA